MEKTPKLPTRHWTYEHDGEVLRLSWGWYHPVVWFVLLPFLLVLGMTLPEAAGWGETSEGSNKGSLMTALIVLFLFGYPCLVSLLNRTHIEASRRAGIKIRHGPLPWFFRPRTVQTEEIRQLHGRGSKSRRDGPPSLSFELHVERHDGATSHLVGVGLTGEEVHFLERTLENHLGIKAQPASEGSDPTDGGG